MHTVAEVLPSKGDEEMTTFNAVGLRATRGENRTVVVDVDVELTNGATGIELQRAASKDYSDGSSLVCELIIKEGAGDRLHSDMKPFLDAYGRKYVVLIHKSALIGVAPIQDG